MLRELNLKELDNEDGRRLKVVANNLPLWNGAQLAVDTTLVSRFAGTILHTFEQQQKTGYAWKQHAEEKK